MPNNSKIGAVILGAGLSSRMGSPKLLLPWGEETVVQSIVRTLKSAGIDQVVLVSGASHQQLEDLFRDADITIAFNPKFENHNMVDSLKVGIQALISLGCDGCLLALGDQPQIEEGVIRVVMEQGKTIKGKLIIPSYQMRRGHPWLFPSDFWDQILMEPPEHTMRDFINEHQESIHYVNVSTASILADMDTPQEYEQEKARVAKNRYN